MCRLQSVDTQREESDSLSPARDGGASRSKITTLRPNLFKKYYLEADTIMSKLDNVHQPDQVAGTVLSKEFYADKPLNRFMHYCVEKCYDTNERLL